MAQNNQAKPINHSLVPAAVEAGRLYETDGGRLTMFSEFGQDPLARREDLMATRMDMFTGQWQFHNIFHSLVNNNKTFFHDALLYFIDITMQLKAQI